MTQQPRQQAVVAVICQDGRYLFVKRSDYVEYAKGYWCPVSGRMEGDETQEQTLEGLLQDAGEEGVTLTWKAREPKPVGKA